MPVKVLEVKDDSLVDIKVNKNYYFMTKASLAYLFKLNMDKGEEAEDLESIKDLKYPDMSDFQRAFYTLSLLVAEIERSAKLQDKVEEREILVPGDEGYVPPTQG
jgi:hypothetical protein